MKNPRTTVTGYLALGAAIFCLLAHWFGSPGAADAAGTCAVLSSAANGLGNIMSADGGH